MAAAVDEITESVIYDLARKIEVDGREILNTLQFSEGLVRREIDLVRIQFEIRLKKLQSHVTTGLKETVEKEKDNILERLHDADTVMNRLKETFNKDQYLLDETKMELDSIREELIRKRLKFIVNEDISNTLASFESFGHCQFIPLETSNSTAEDLRSRKGNVTAKIGSVASGLIKSCDIPRKMNVRVSDASESKSYIPLGTESTTRTSEDVNTFNSQRGNATQCLDSVTPDLMIPGRSPRETNVIASDGSESKCKRSAGFSDANPSHDMISDGISLGKTTDEAIKKKYNSINISSKHESQDERSKQKDDNYDCADHKIVSPKGIKDMCWRGNETSRSSNTGGHDSEKSSIKSSANDSLHAYCNHDQQGKQQLQDEQVMTLIDDTVEKASEYSRYKSTMYPLNTNSIARQPLKDQQEEQHPRPQNHQTQNMKQIITDSRDGVSTKLNLVESDSSSDTDPFAVSRLLSDNRFRRNGLDKHMSRLAQLNAKIDQMNDKKEHERTPFVDDVTVNGCNVRASDVKDVDSKLDFRKSAGVTANESTEDIDDENLTNDAQSRKRSKVNSNCQNMTQSDGIDSKVEKDITDKRKSITNHENRNGTKNTNWRNGEEGKAFSEQCDVSKDRNEALGEAEEEEVITMSIRNEYKDDSDSETDENENCCEVDDDDEEERPVVSRRERVMRANVMWFGQPMPESEARTRRRRARSESPKSTRRTDRNRTEIDEVEEGQNDYIRNVKVDTGRDDSSERNQRLNGARNPPGKERDTQMISSVRKNDTNDDRHSGRFGWDKRNAYPTRNGNASSVSNGNGREVTDGSYGDACGVARPTGSHGCGTGMDIGSRGRSSMSKRMRNRSLTGELPVNLREVRKEFEVVNNKSVGSGDSNNDTNGRHGDSWASSWTEQDNGFNNFERSDTGRKELQTVSGIHGSRLGAESQKRHSDRSVSGQGQVTAIRFYPGGIVREMSKTKPVSKDYIGKMYSLDNNASMRPRVLSTRRRLYSTDSLNGP